MRLKVAKIKFLDKKVEMLERTYAQEQEKIRIKKDWLEMKKFKEEERIIMWWISIVCRKINKNSSSTENWKSWEKKKTEVFSNPLDEES